MHFVFLLLKLMNIVNNCYHFFVILFKYIKFNNIVIIILHLMYL
jgi:hypothetical protein